MNTSFRLTAILSLVLGLTAAARADQYQLSYTFGPNSTNDNNDDTQGPTVIGTFDGTANGNMITVISDMVLSVELPGGTLAPISADVFGDSAPGSYSPGAAVVSFDGTQNNFTFNNSDDYYNTVVFDSETLFGFSGGSNPTTELYVQSRYADDFFLDVNDYLLMPGPPNDDGLNSSWDVQQIPDAGATAFLIGGALASLAILRGRFSPGDKSRSRAQHQ